VSDALAMTLLKTRQFSSEEYAALHPGESSGGA
jgi:D-arabinose 5-phosphate isomerase GutQ